jgi:hypothetical protein
MASHTIEDILLMASGKLCTKLKMCAKGTRLHKKMKNAFVLAYFWWNRGKNCNFLPTYPIHYLAFLSSNCTLLSL